MSVCLKCVERAIRYVECSRTTHALWAEYYDRYPETVEEYRGTHAGPDEQRETVRDYDYVLGVLRELLPVGNPLRTAAPRRWRPRYWDSSAWGGEYPPYKGAA